MSSSTASGAVDTTAEAGNGEASGERKRKYKGVRRRKWGKWVSEIRLPNSRERVWLGSYDSPDKAARAFDAAFVCLRGPNAAGTDLNFPDSPPPLLTRRLDAAAAVDPQEVQAAALSHANRRAPVVVSASDESSRPATTMDPPAPGAMDDYDVLGGGAEVAWRPAMAPLYSPTGWPAGNAYDFFLQPFGDDEDIAIASLWSFDP